MIVKEDGEANFYTILDREGHWFARVQLNGELTVAEQRKIVGLMANAKELQAGLVEAKDAMDERRAYCEAWEWKYRERWNKEDRAVDAVIAMVKV